MQGPSFSLRNFSRAKLSLARLLAMVAVFSAVALAATFAAAESKQATPATATNQPIKAYHDGSIKDLDAIGNRNVGCGQGVGNWYSVDRQVAMGKTFAQQVESSAKLINDPVVTEYINRIGQNLVRNSDARVPFTIKVIDDDSINAFALPGGFFYVNSGLILAADDEAELAGVMAHEISHVAACHAAREQTRGQLFNLASIPLIFVGGPAGYAVSQAASIALPMSFLKFSRGFESQADYLGVEYMYKAGYDPQAFISFFEKIEAKEKKKPGTLAKVFETHPPNETRMKKAEQEITTLLPPRDQYMLDTSEFEDVKARLSEIINHSRVLRDKTDASRPTLRRAEQTSSPTSPGDTSSKDKKSGDDPDRPTLKRRPDGPDQQ